MRWWYNYLILEGTQGMAEDVKAREGSNSFGHVSVIKPFNVSEKFAKKSDLVCNGSTIPSKGRRARFAIPVFACKHEH